MRFSLLLTRWARIVLVRCSLSVPRWPILQDFTNDLRPFCYHHISIGRFQLLYQHTECMSKSAEGTIRRVFGAALP